MPRKYKKPKRQSKKLFKNTAGRVHKMNSRTPIQRGGTRL